MVVLLLIVYIHFEREYLDSKHREQGRGGKRKFLKPKSGFGGTVIFSSTTYMPFEMTMMKVYGRTMLSQKINKNQAHDFSTASSSFSFSLSSLAVKKQTKKEKQAAKDPNKPKRPANAFFVFMEDFRKQYKEKHPKNKVVAAVSIIFPNRLCLVPLKGAEDEMMKNLDQ